MRLKGYVMRIVGFANGTPCPLAGQYLKSFEHHTADGKGYGEFVADPRQAQLFRTAMEALEFYRQRSLPVPKRPDGQPNRPLTCSTVEIISLTNAINQDVAMRGH